MSDVIFWRAKDGLGFELLRLQTTAEGVQAQSTVLSAKDGGSRIEHAWVLTPAWRTISLRVERLDTSGRRTVELTRDGSGWRVDGRHRPDLDGAEEPDLSATPFCNTLFIRRLRATRGSSLTADVAFVSGDDLSVVRSKQRYDFKDAHRFRYVDLGLYAGFEADLQVDEDGLVEDYEQLFERVTA